MVWVSHTIVSSRVNETTEDREGSHLRNTRRVAAAVEFKIRPFFFLSVEEQESMPFYVGFNKKINNNCTCPLAHSIQGGKFELWNEK